MASADLPAVPSVPGRLVRLDPDAEPEIHALDASAFVFPTDPGRTLQHFEWDRTFGVRADDGELAGANTTFSMRLSLPTGRLGEATTVVPMGGLSWVSVHPGYRRRGLLTAMIGHHLAELHARGEEAVSGLHASEAGIYGRFGYGLATTGFKLALGRGAALRDLPGDADDGLRVRFSTADFDQHGDLIADVYTRACAVRPGMVDRPPQLTRDRMLQTARDLEKEEPLRILVVERDGAPTAYALVHRSMTWKDSSPAGSTRVLELASTDLRSEHRLWRAVTDFDLTTETTAWRVPADAAVLTWLTDPRSASPTRVDELWLRIVDVDRALAARGYAGDVDVALAVSDAICPWNTGTWRLRGGPDGATCERTDDEPDLSLDVRELGAALPGGMSLAAAHAAGLVQERTPGAVTALSVAMRSALEPATTFGF